MLCVPEPPRSSPNGRKCYTCGGQSCNENLNCEGSEDRCMSVSGRDVDISVKDSVNEQTGVQLLGPESFILRQIEQWDQKIDKSFDLFWPATRGFKPHTHRLRDCFSLSDFRGTEHDPEGLRLQGFLRKRKHATYQELWNRLYLLSGRLLQQRQHQQRQHQQRQPAAPGGIVHPSDHFFLRSENP